MKVLAQLLSNDLGYIWGERESGPNGEKKAFISRGRAFLTALGRDLGLEVQKVNVNKAGIAVSGDVTLIGMWETNGIYISVTQSLKNNAILYRTIERIDDYRGGRNQYIALAELQKADYVGLLMKMLELKKTAAKLAA
jgi:hypothetical protein